MRNVIEIINLSKIYRLGEIGTGTISRDLERWYKMKIRGQEDPYIKIGEINDRNLKGESDIVYSLLDINLNIIQGEILGIIGKNGAGKSTLLKIISRITSPSTGRIKIKGRVASLLEVGTGFHPELTGRENIFLNGAILGMRKLEIIQKLDEIIDFSGVERYIDTPVKRYSSGMYVRLAFAVAAHLESEILIVDEVLAVGDAEFQKKCIKKMGDISKGDGRTVLFVSHNMVAISNLCPKSIWLENGSIKDINDSVTIINEYTQKDYHKLNENIVDLTNNKDFKGNGVLKIGNVSINNKVHSSSNKYIEIIIQVLNNERLKGSLEIAGKITDNNNTYVHYFGSKLKGKVYLINSENILATLKLIDVPLMPGEYLVSFELKFNSEIVYITNEVLKLRIGEYDFYDSGVVWNNGLVFISQTWE